MLSQQHNYCIYIIVVFALYFFGHVLQLNQNNAIFPLISPMPEAVRQLHDDIPAADVGLDGGDVADDLAPVRSTYKAPGGSAERKVGSFRSFRVIFNYALF